MNPILLIPSGLLAYGAALWWRLRRIHRWELQTGPHLVTVERRAFCLQPLLRISLDGLPRMSVNYREIGLVSQLLGGGYKFEFQDSGRIHDANLWTDVDFFCLRLRCVLTIDRGERQLLTPLIDGVSSRGT